MCAACAPCASPRPRACSVGAINFGFIDTGAAKSATGTKVVIAIGVFTVVNAVFNCFVLCKHPAFKAKPAGELGQPAAKMSDEVSARALM